MRVVEKIHVGDVIYFGFFSKSQEIHLDDTFGFRLINWKVNREYPLELWCHLI